MFRNFRGRLRRALTRAGARSLAGAPGGPDPETQRLLARGYQRLREEGRPLPAFSEVGFQCHSETDEDGILLFMFAVLGTTNRTVVELCAGDGVQCNAANLLLNHGWRGLLVDGDRRSVARGQRYYAGAAATRASPPAFTDAWITRGNVNALLREHGMTGEIDLLSLDLDGVDWWIWQALEVVTPRIVVLEYQDILGPDRAWTVPYADDFSCRRYPMTDGMPNYAGASLSAFVKLGLQKGYRLVGTNRLGYNAFFVREGLGEPWVPEISASACFAHPKVQQGMRERFPTVQHLPWVEV